MAKKPESLLTLVEEHLQTIANKRAVATDLQKKVAQLYSEISAVKDSAHRKVDEHEKILKSTIKSLKENVKNIKYVHQKVDSV